MHFLGMFLVKMIAGIAVVLVILTLLLSYECAAWRKRVKKHRKQVVFFGVLFIFIFFFIGHSMSKVPSFDYFVQTVGPGIGPQLSMESAVKFLVNLDKIREVANIARDPADVPALSESREVAYVIDVEEVINEVAPGVIVSSWVYNGKVPGPLLRAKVGDKVSILLKNSKKSLHTHSIDFHAVTGPGGGAAVLQVPPGEERSLTFKAVNPGVYVYHCATPNVGAHMTHGLYGLILIEPEEGLPIADKEFYVMQGEVYTSGHIGKKGLQIFDAKKFLSGDPTYVIFNGRIGSLEGKMKARVGDKVRIYVGNGGVNLASNFHVIGEIFDTVYPEGGTPVQQNIQTTLVPAGGATIVEFTVDLPGKYILVDHALARLDKGAWGTLEVEGAWDDTLYFPQPLTSSLNH